MRTKETWAPYEFADLGFHVEIDGIEVAGFKECSPITIETEVYEYPVGGENSYVLKLPGRTKYSNITLKRGIDPGQDLFQWFEKGLDGNPVPRKNISIVFYSNALGDVVRRWDLIGAYPVKWVGPDMKAEVGAVAVETLEFAFLILGPSSET